MSELEQLKNNFLRSLKAAEEQSGLDLSWLKAQYLQLFEAAQPSAQAYGAWTCPKCNALYGGELPDNCIECGTPRR